jgi:hypothetical protein
MAQIEEAIAMLVKARIGFVDIMSSILTSNLPNSVSNGQGEVTNYIKR